MIRNEQSIYGCYAVLRVCVQRLCFPEGTIFTAKRRKGRRVRQILLGGNLRGIIRVYYTRVEITDCAKRRKHVNSTFVDPGVRDEVLNGKLQKVEMDFGCSRAQIRTGLNGSAAVGRHHIHTNPVNV